MEPDQNPIPFPQRPQIFRRVLERPKRAKLTYAIAAVVAVLAALAVAAHRDSREYLVVTPKGIKTVKRDMARAEVGSILGTPLAAGHDEGCYRYGTPKLDAEFTLYLVCYEDGRVTGLTEERFEARQIEPPEPKAAAAP